MQRISALKQVAFDKAGFDGYLVFNESNLVYFTGAHGTTALLIPRDGEGIVFVYGVNYEQAKAEAKGSTALLVNRGDSLMAKIAQSAQNQGVRKLALDSISIEGWRSLAKETKGMVKLKPRPDFAAQLRLVKDDGEIALMRKAAELTNGGMRTAYEVVTAGMHEYKVAAEIEYAMRKHGSYGTAFDTIVSSGLSSAFPHGGCTDRQIRPGELVVVDIGAVYKNYRSDMTRTLVTGKASEKQRKLHEIVKKAHASAFAAIKPETKARDVDAAARRIIEEAGYADKFVHGLGHGVGLDIHEPPTLNTSSKEKLQAGNIVTDEPGIYLVGYGGVRIEDTVLVTKDGAEKLTIGPYGLDTE